MSDKSTAESKMQDRGKLQGEYYKGRSNAMSAGYVIYFGVVVVGTVLFISFVLTAFPVDAYFTRAIMSVGGVLVAGSLLAFPYALHNWATYGNHRKAAVALYFGELIFFGMNVIVSFSVLLAAQKETLIPAWMVEYEPFTIISIVYVIVAWGILFWLDPESQKKTKMVQSWQAFDEQVIKTIEKYPDSIEGRQAIQEHAKLRVIQAFSIDDGSPQPFAGGMKASEVEQVKQQKN